MQQVRQASESANLTPRLKNLLQQISDYSNVPRKKVKFQNFLRNSLRVMDDKTCEQLWEIFSATKNKQNQEQSVTSQSDRSSDKSKEETNQESSEQGVNETAIQPEANKKEATDKKKKHKKGADKDDASEAHKDGETIHLEKKKKKKETIIDKNVSENGFVNKKGKERTHKTPGDDNNTTNSPSDPTSNGLSTCNSHKKKKKKSKKNKEDKVVDAERDDESMKSRKRKREEEEGNHKVKRQHKSSEDIQEDIVADERDTTSGELKNIFNWKASIKLALKSAPEKELSIKKLRKKVFRDFRSHGGIPRLENEEDMTVAFDHNIHGSKKFVVFKKKVRLVKS
ncbi:uncharacterized protein LOC144446750 isoform X2 [Glandiceps talaboti]